MPPPRPPPTRAQLWIAPLAGWAPISLSISLSFSACGSHDPGFAFTDDAAPGGITGHDGGSSGSSGSTSSGQSTGSSSSGAPSSSSSGGVADSGGSSGSASVDSGSGSGGDSGVPICGTTPCDLKANTCCVGVGTGGTATGQCLPGTSASCPALTAAFHCQQQSDCSTGQVCCGILTTVTARTECQTVAAGGSCSPPPSSTQASAQLCKSDAECKNAASCIAQTCAGGAMLQLCGLQSQAPFNCTKN